MEVEGIEAAFLVFFCAVWAGTHLANPSGSDERVALASALSHVQLKAEVHLISLFGFKYEIKDV